MKKIFFVLGLFLVPILALVTACGSKSSPSSPAAATPTATPSASTFISGVASGIQFSNGSLDAAGNMYVADSGNNEIWKITSAGVTSIFASGFTGNPTDAAVNSAGTTCYVAGNNDNEVWAVTAGGTPLQLGGVFSFINPQGVALNAAGTTLYIADKVRNQVESITLASPNTASVFASGSNFSDPTGVAVDSSGNVYYANIDGNSIGKITSGGTSSIIAGNGTAGDVDGSALTTAEFDNPIAVALDSKGDIYVADQVNNKIREISGGQVTTYAGTGTQGSQNGAALSTTFNSPQGVWLDAAGDVFVGDTGNKLLRKIIP